MYEVEEELVRFSLPRFQELTLWISEPATSLLLAFRQSPLRGLHLRRLYSFTGEQVCGIECAIYQHQGMLKQVVISAESRDKTPGSELERLRLLCEMEGANFELKEKKA